MKTKDCHYLGHISKAIGFEGSLLIFLEADDPSLFLEQMESVFILIDGKLVPFFIDDIHWRETGKEAVIKLEDIDNTEKARELCNRKMYLPWSKLPGKHPEQKKYSDIISYKAYTTNNYFLGVVENVIEYPENPVLQIIKEKREILIPAADQFILDVNHHNKTIILAPPDGLLDLYQ